MSRRIEIGDRVICSESGVIGRVLKFYTPTSCEEQTMVEVDEGIEYHAPTRTWNRTTEAGNITIKLPLAEDNHIVVIQGRGSGKSWLMNALKHEINEVKYNE